MITTKEEEQAILGYMIYHSLDSPLITEQSFFYEKHKDLYKLIIALRKAGKVVHSVTIQDEIRHSKRKFAFKFMDVENLESGLIGTQFMQTHFNFHVRSLLKKNRQQDLLKTFQKATTYKATEDLWPAFKRLYEAWDSLELESGIIENFTIGSNAKDLEKFLKKKRSGDLMGHRIKSFPRLTSALMGFREIIVLSAKPKIGKSTFALQIESEIADLGVGIIHYDFENGRYNLMMREACRRFNIDYRKELLNDTWPGLDSMIKKVEDIKNFAIITERGLTIDKIRAHIFEMRNKTGNEDVLITIDSLQKLPMDNLRERRSSIDFWLRNFEELNEDPYLTILLISEVSRESQKPKESGDIEYTGHFLLRLENNQEENDIRGRGDFGTRDLWIEYARDTARAGPIRYQANFNYWKFAELDENI